MRTAAGSLEPRKFSVDAGTSRWMMLRRHCRAMHSGSQRRQLEKLKEVQVQISAYGLRVNSVSLLPLVLNLLSDCYCYCWRCMVYSASCWINNKRCSFL